MPLQLTVTCSPTGPRQRHGVVVADLLA